MAPALRHPHLQSPCIHLPPPPECQLTILGVQFRGLKCELPGKRLLPERSSLGNLTKPSLISTNSKTAQKCKNNYLATQNLSSSTHGLIFFCHFGLSDIGNQQWPRSPLDGRWAEEIMAEETCWLDPQGGGVPLISLPCRN